MRPNRDFAVSLFTPTDDFRTPDRSSRARAATRSTGRPLARFSTAEYLSNPAAWPGSNRLDDAFSTSLTER